MYTDVVWTQWVVWDNVTTNLSRNLNSKPIDPLTETEYTYSVINSQTQYELLSVYESDLLSFGPPSIRLKGRNLGWVTQTNAANQAYPKIDWTYNWVFVKTPKYYIPTPSIINSELNWTWIELSQSNINSQVVTWWDNITSNWTNPSSTWWLDDLTFNVFTWSLDDDSDKKDLAEIIIWTYTWSSLANTDIYKSILETPEDELVILVNNVVLGWDLVSTSAVSYSDCEFSWEPVLHTESVTAYFEASVEYWNTCNSEQRTCTDWNLSWGFTFTWCTVDWATWTFDLSDTNVDQWITVIITNNCSETPTSYTSSNTSVATISWITISTVWIWTTNITPVLWACADNTLKTLTVNTSPPPTQVSECIFEWQMWESITIYDSCDTPDTIICTWSWEGFIIAACNVWATKWSEYNLCIDALSCTSLRVWNYYQFGKSDISHVDWTFESTYDWEASWWIDWWSANYWWVKEQVSSTAIFTTESIYLDKLKMRWPCTIGYHIPTYFEWISVIISWDWFLWNISWDIEWEELSDIIKLPMAGYRSYLGGGNFNSPWIVWKYRTSSPDGKYGRAISFTDSRIYPDSSEFRAHGYNIRCFKD